MKKTQTLIITKKNCLEYLQAYRISSKTFIKGLKRFCKISPEFTHDPQLQVFQDGLLYKSDYSYGKFIVRLRFEYFYFDCEKILKYEVLTFDLESFDIKKASQSRISKMCGELPPWYDPERKLSHENTRLVKEYIDIETEMTQLRNKIKRTKRK